ncbi:hypothetical protein [uncultured Fibrobacter sp.]|uniref:hypothetical protein n=1 Tax=uncultured Fibrobacter sp. TaxID=261512 RepID=UPI0025FEBA9E|nr:hypothetical protein [uncultured Fibrobacter sp.]
MNRNMYMIARHTDWKVLEDFYKDVEGGLEKVEKMKRYCDLKDDKDTIEPYYAYKMRYAEVNKEYLFDRYRKLNEEFVWTEENLDKLIRLDQHIRKLEYEMYQKFVGIKQNLDGLIAQGFDAYRDYQVTGEINYDAMYIDDDEHEQKYDWLCGLLQDYADMRALDWFTFGDGEDPEDPCDNENCVFEAWGKWLKYDYFVKNGMTKFLCHLMDNMHHSLYSYSDIVNMDLRCFYLNYDISL